MTERSLDAFQSYLSSDLGIEHFTARELCKLNTSHDFNDKQHVVPPPRIWHRCEGVLKVADALREYWGDQVIVSDGDGGGFYRPPWYQKGLYRKGKSSASESAHSLLTGIDITPAKYPIGKTNQHWIERAQTVVDSMRATSLSTALGVYDDGHIHLEIGTPIDMLDGRTSKHARW